MIFEVQQEFIWHDIAHVRYTNLFFLKYFLNFPFEELLLSLDKKNISNILLVKEEIIFRFIIKALCK